MQLSVNLVGVVSQTLVRRQDGRGRIAAHEVMVATSAVRNLIRESKTYQINSIIQTGARQNMNTLDQSLASLVERSLITREDARQRSKDPLEFDRLLAIDARKAKQASDVPPPTAAGARPVTPTTPARPVQQSFVRGQPNRPAYRRD
jgi:twitching motility protein PilT